MNKYTKTIQRSFYLLCSINFFYRTPRLSYKKPSFDKIAGCFDKERHEKTIIAAVGYFQIFPGPDTKIIEYIYVFEI